MRIEEIYEVRRKTLEHYINESEHRGNVAAFARQHGFDDNRIRHILNEVRPMGEKSAREMEEALDLPPYFFDFAFTQNPQAVSAAIMDLSPRDVEEILRHIRLMKSDSYSASSR